eukprot:6183818-Pleurochrysis_carterae.AAC.1
MRSCVGECLSPLLVQFQLLELLLVNLRGHSSESLLRPKFVFRTVGRLPTDVHSSECDDNVTIM